MAATTQVRAEEFRAYRSGTYNIAFPSYSTVMYGDVWLGRIASIGNGRGFLVFDLSGLHLGEKTIVEAELRVQLIHYRSHDPSVTFQFFDVGGIPPLNPPEPRAQRQVIYEDLGSGASYGSATAVYGQSDQIFSVSLASPALDDIATARGGDFAVGLARPMPPNDGYLHNYIAIGPGSTVTHLPDYVPSLKLTLASTPVANADGPYSGHVGEAIVLDASASVDPDNDLASYMWDLDDDGVFETDAGGDSVYVVSNEWLESLGLGIGGPYDIHVKVTDDWGLSDTDRSILTIVPEPASLSLLTLVGWVLIYRKRK